MVKKYECSICGYVYDEGVGDPENGILAGTKWKDVPEDWVCPLCGASKAEFNAQLASDPVAEQDSFINDDHADDEMRQLTFGELSALCSNLSKGCEKQYRNEEAGLFNQLAKYYQSKVEPVEQNQFADLLAMVQQDLNSGYVQAHKTAANEADRGALRALTWGEKVTKILNSLLNRYEKQQAALLENTNVYVCEICGFLYIGEEAPDICPVCKVPKLKLTQIQRG
jgi:rubredoxin